MSKQTKPRKARTIKNGIVDIDNVFVDRGVAFQNWIDIAKHKLWERELSLLQLRRESCDDIIISMIQSFATSHAEIFDAYHQNVYEMETTTTTIYQKQLQPQITDAQSSIMIGYMRSVQNALTNWGGCHPKKKEIHTFREYFQCCRSWFDQIKMKRLAGAFWIPLIDLVEELSRKAASQTFHKGAVRLQSVYSDYLKTWILQNIFEGQINPNNCRQMWLVPATAYDAIRKQYLPNLVIQKIIGSKNQDIRASYLHAIGNQIVSLKQSFEAELSAFYTQSTTNSHRGQSELFTQSTYAEWTTPQQKPMYAEWGTFPEFQMNDPYSVMYNNPSPPPPPFVPDPFCQSPSPTMPFTSIVTSEFDVYAFQNN